MTQMHRVTACLVFVLAMAGLPAHAQQGPPPGLDIQALARRVETLEVEGAVIATPALKIKVAGGLNFPSVSFRVLAVYFFGAR